MAGPRRARVTVAYATCKVVDPATGTTTVLGFYQGAPLPPNADPENVKSLVRRQYAEWMDEPAPEPEREPEKPADDKAEPKKAAPAKKAG
jgi:hypothetical protein